MQPSAARFTPSGPVHSGPASFSECKEQQLVFLLVRQLAAAQFELANPALSQRLWQEVAALEIDPERITHLLYGGHDVEDRRQLQLLDGAWCQQQCAARRGWFRRVTGGVWRRGAPPAPVRAHQPTG